MKNENKGECYKGRKKEGDKVSSEEGKKKERKIR